MWGGKHNKYLNKNDPVDKIILDLSKKGILKVGIIKI